jgi:hypothetical protein
VDNCGNHKHPEVKEWPAKHKRIRRGILTSVADLIAAVMSYVNQHNENPRSFTWTAKADDILAKVARARAVLISAK